MKSKVVFYLIGISVFFSCGNHTEVVERSEKEYKVITDSIESVMPGQLFVNADYILWTNPFTTEKNVHILDKKMGNEILKIVNTGKGPEEFITPSVGYVQDNKVFVFDLNSDKAAYYQLSAEGSSDVEFIKRDRQGETRYLEVSQGQLLSFNPLLEKPFKFNNEFWGKLPFDQSIKNNGSVSQGNILYNSDRQYLIYSTMSFSYLSIYQIKDGKINFISEKKKEFDYDIVDGEMKLNRKRKGASEMALTSDYIVTLERDYVTDDMDESTVGRDFTKLPHTVFLYDYDLNLKKILNLGMPILRIAADPKENYLYAIGINPDFMIIKCDL